MPRIHVKNLSTVRIALPSDIGIVKPGTTLTTSIPGVQLEAGRTEITRLINTGKISLVVEEDPVFDNKTELPTVSMLINGAIPDGSITTPKLADGAVTEIKLADDSVSNAKLRNSQALSVIGRSANSAGDPGDIATTAGSKAVLREDGSVLGFGTVEAAGIADGAVETKLAAATGPVSFNNQRLIDVADPATSQDAATKAYVDGALSGALTIPVSCLSTDAVGGCVKITGTKSGGLYPVTTVDLADAGNGIAVGMLVSKSTPTTGVAMLRGVVTGIHTGLSPGKTYAINTDGTIIRTPPSPAPGTSLFVQHMGWALDDGEFLVSPVPTATIRHG